FDESTRVAQNPPGAGHRSETHPPLSTTRSISLNPRDRTWKSGRSASHWWMRNVVDAVAPRQCPLTEVVRQQGVRRLVGRKVRGDVDDVHLRASGSRLQAPGSMLR